jgi:alpha-beta hydrolase superfamily lysophospholipase
MLPVAAQAGLSFCIFDFAGSGRSEGEFSSLGFWESKDINKVLMELLHRGFREFVLWGRSMGAVAACLHMPLDFGHVRGLILDSPFCSLRRLVKDIAWNRFHIPGVIS